MDIYSVLEKIADLKSKDGKKYDYSRARLKESYNQFVNLWKSYYSGNVAGIHNDTGYNGEETYPIKRQSMKVPKLLAEKWSTGLFSEAFTVTLKDDIETDKLRKLEKTVDFRSKINQSAIFGYGMGTAALLASADIETDKNTETITGGRVKLDIVKYDSIFPLVFDQNNIKSIAFVRQEQIKDKTIYVISIHTLEKENVTVENITATVKGEKVDFSEPETVKQSQAFNNQMFCIIKPNICNDYSDTLPFGQSIFADSLAACENIDLAADLLRRDVEEGAQITIIGRDLLMEKIGKNGKKKKLFENTKGRFFTIPQALGEKGGDIKQLFEKSVPEIRAQALWQVVKDNLNWACITSGLGKDSLDVIPRNTATEVIHSESEKMQNRSLHIQYLENEIIKLVKALCELSTLTGNPIDSSVINIVFEDSVIVDTAAEKNLAMRELDMGIISAAEYREKFFGETPDKAKEHIEGKGDNSLDKTEYEND